MKVDANNNTVFADDNFRIIRVIDDNTALSQYLNSKPITMKDIFNEWNRFAHYNQNAMTYLDYSNCSLSSYQGQNRTDHTHYTSFTDKTQNGWSFDETTNSIKDNNDMDTYAGFVSNNNGYKNYNIKCKVNTIHDDDHFTIIVGYMKDSNGIEHTLSIARAAGHVNSGNSDTYYGYGTTLGPVDTRVWYALIYDMGNSTQKILKDMSKEVKISTFSVTGKTHTICLLGVDRVNDNFTFHTCSFVDYDANDLKYDSNFDMTWSFPNIKPNDWTEDMYNNIRKMLDLGHFGFGVRSNIATFTILEQRGLFDDNTVYNLATNKMYDYKNNTWIESGTIDNNLPYRSFLYNKELGKLYFYYGPNDYVQIVYNNTTSITTQSVNTLSYKSLDMYPIGSVYTSTINTDPKELFGGEWKTIDNNNNTVIYMWERIS